MSKISLKHSGGKVVSLNSPTTEPNANDVAFKLPNADGSANEFLKTDGSGNLSFGAVSSDFVKISTNSVSSAVAQVDLDFDTSTYSQVLMFMEGFKFASDAVNLYARFKVGGTVQTGGNYVSQTKKAYQNGFDTNQYGGQDQTYMYITNNIGNNGFEHWNGQLRLQLGSGNANGLAFMTITTLYRDPSGNYAVNFGAAGYQDTSSVVNGIRFYASSGNITSGKITLYGMK